MIWAAVVIVMGKYLTQIHFTLFRESDNGNNDESQLFTNPSLASLSDLAARNQFESQIHSDWEAANKHKKIKILKKNITKLDKVGILNNFTQFL